MENSTKEERKMIDSEYTRLVLDENRNNLEENDETIVSECIVNILHKENNNLGIHETNIEKESHSDGNNKIDENERALSTTHQQENAPLETSTEEENNLPNENQNKKYNMSQVALSSRGNVPIEKIWEKHLKWPEFEKKDHQKVNQEPNSLKKNLLYAITSSKWKHYYELIKREQEEKERKAAERLVKQNIKKELVEVAKAEKRKARAEKAKEKEEKENIKKELVEAAKAEKRKAMAEKAKEKEEKAEMKKKAKIEREQTSKPKTRHVQLKKRP